jgi:hypothetical protein
VLSEPSTIAVDDVGNLIVLDQQGKSLVTYDNFGSYITRQKLPVACSRIAVTADTIVLLSTERASQTSTGAQGQYLRLSSPTLVRLGDLDELRFSTRRPEESQIDIIPRRPVVDFAISGSKGVLIDGQFLEHLRLIPIAESPKPQ